MALTIVDTWRPVTGGVDTHLDLNVTTAPDGAGGLLGVEQLAHSFMLIFEIEAGLVECRLEGFGSDLASSTTISPLAGVIATINDFVADVSARAVAPGYLTPNADFQSSRGRLSGSAADARAFSIQATGLSCLSMPSKGSCQSSPMR